ncbi:MAG: hypothetical protein ACWGQW_03235 [bacterium]
MRHGKGKGKGRDRNDNQERTYQPREWTLAETLEKGRIRVEITTSRNQNGTKMHSVSIRKKIFDRDGEPVIDFEGKEKTTGFFRREDMADIGELAIEAQRWIDADKHEDQQSKSAQNGRKNHAQPRA